jgi:hypothetical protein
MKSVKENDGVKTRNMAGKEFTSNRLLPTLGFLHFIFLFVFSGMEFTLTFMTYDR